MMEHDEVYRGWTLSHCNHLYVAEHSRKVGVTAISLLSLKRIVREKEIGSIKLTKGTPSPDGAVFHYTTYMGESFTVRRYKLWNREIVRWEVFADGGPHKGRLIHSFDRLADARYWLYSYQDDQMLKDDRNAKA